MNTLYLCPSGVSALEYFKREKISKSLEEFLKDSGKDVLMKASAEINSLYRMGLNSGDRVVFFSSDTDKGEMVARAIAKVLEKLPGCNVNVRRIQGLQTDDKKRYDTEGIPNLTDAIINEVETHLYIYDIVLNATAGFKANVPYLTFIGMIFHLPICYIFEGSESIIELPPIPIEFDLERLRRIEPAIDRIMADYLSVEEFREITGYSYEEVRQDAKDILFLEDDYVTFRPVGRILYKRYLQVKGNKIYLSPTVLKKLESGSYNRRVFEDLFRKMKDPIHLQSKLHPKIKKKGEINLECYKAGSTNERIFFFIDDKRAYICDIFLHDEYERAIEQGCLLREKFKNAIKGFKEAQL